MSIDFTVPIRRWVPIDLMGGRRVAFIPLALLSKKVLRNFDVRDESDAALPILTQDQNSALATEMLRVIAAGVLHPSPLDPALDLDIVTLVSGDEVSAHRAFSNFQRPAGPGPHDQRTSLWSAPRFSTLAADFANHFVLFVPLPAEGGERRIVKLAYDEPYEPHDRGLKQLIGIDPVPFRALVPSLGMAESYHAEVEAPEDIVVASAELRELLPDGTTELLDEDARVFRAHLHASNRTRGALGLVVVHFRLRRAGMMLAGLLIAALTTCILGTGWLLQHYGWHSSNDLAGALLVGLPGLFAAYLARPGEHRIVKRLVGGIRAIVLLEAAVSFAAAGSLAVSFSGTARSWFWGIAALISLVATALIAGAWGMSKWRDR